MDYRFFLLSQMFSCLSFRRYHEKVELYTDHRGFDLFIKDLSLPYDNISLALDELDEVDHRLWALGKLKVISDQKSPFLHVDNDVYIWEKIMPVESSKFLLAQSRILTPVVYSNTLSQIREHFDYIPACLKTDQEFIANIGIIGGSDLDFFGEFCETSYDFLNRNIDRLEFIEVGRLNQILDEYLFSSLCSYKDLNIQYLIDSSNETTPLSCVLRYNLVPIIDKYIHLVGIAKQNVFACEQLEMRAKLEFPYYYKKVLDVCDGYGLHSYDTAKVNMASRFEGLKMLYTSTIDQILLRKFVLVDELTPEPSSPYSNTPLPNDAIGQNTTISDSNSDILFKFFETPTSISEILECFRSQRSDFSDLDKLEFKLLDWVLEKLVVEGTLAMPN